MKIAIIGDLHLSSGYRCRTGDFLQDMFDKLNHVAENNDIIICLGDFFDKCSESISFFNRVYGFLKTLNKKCDVLTIVGNHDLFHHSYASMNKTTLGAMQLTGVLKVMMETFTIDNAVFDVSSCKKDLSKLGDSDNCKILLGHNYYDMPDCDDESFNEQEIRKLNYNMIFLGHEHVGYDPKHIGNSILYRSGNMSRITCDMYNFDRKIYYYQLDSETLECVKREVPSRPVNEIYIEDAFSKSSTTKKSNYAGLSALLAKLDKRTSQDDNLSLPKVIRRLGGKEEHITYLREIHREHNIRFD